jgi:hypothetical protein
MELWTKKVYNLDNRVERHRTGEGGKLIVFRLSDLEEFLADLVQML